MWLELASDCIPWEDRGAFQIQLWPAGLFRKEAVHERKYFLISRPNDPQIQFLRALQSTKGRSESGQYLIEGIRHVARAFEEKAPFDRLIVEPSTLSNAFGQKLARRIRQAGVPQFLITPRLYRGLTLSSEPQGIAAVLRKRWTPLNELVRTSHALWLAIESIDQPGNLGTILRTAEAAGVAGIFVLGNGADPWDPACVRASMGGLFSQKLIRCTNREFLEWARDSRIRVVASTPSGMLNYKALRSCKAMVLLIGSEKLGLSNELLECADFTVRIPMQGRCDSINAAVATGVLLFEYAERDGSARTSDDRI